MSSTLYQAHSATLLRKLVEGQAYRQLLLGNIRGAGIQMLPDVASKGRMAHDLEHSLRLMEQVEGIHREVGGSDLVSEVRPRIDRVPMPESQLELSVALALLGRAEYAAAGGFVESCHEGLAVIARDLVDSVREEAEAQARVFIEACTHPARRSSAQTYWSRWFPIALRSLGRPRTRQDEQAQELGLRGASAGECIRRFVCDAEPMRRACGLNMPSLNQLGVELPEDLRGRFPEGGLHA
ncbi:MAG: hypothetical protein QGI93_01640 [Planctomycetota bacterium]|jgi:hypothetical protein|nr:hypothetical protein [Candidatus Woesearchaeota archaeon]MDP6384873.1 hypothetical protein [Planctomycetota bacterium]MDP6739171.1 hypothetical protein [Planctomycetota bacterium]MDP6938428.1 hypothetical protein [Planctomycetota bacterium]